jgi:hypothetical protein
MRKKGRSGRIAGFFPVALAFFAALVLLGGGCAHLAPRKLAPGPAVAEGKIEFRFYAPSARRVQLAGDWPENNWGRGDGSAGEANIGLMDDRNGDGIWEITVALGPGRYRYLFWVDETRWCTDPGRPEEVSGGPAGFCSQIVLFSNGGRMEIR